MCLFLSNRIVDKIDGTRVVVTTTCGHCIECLKKRQNDWKLRICHECQRWLHCYFFTLTYRDDMLPCNVCYDDVFGEILFSGRYPDCAVFINNSSPNWGLCMKSTACKKDVQDFIKRFREDMSRKLGKRWPCKYFICAEYGPNPNGTKRPHYHGILLCNDSKVDILPYFDSWRIDFGRIDFQEVGIGREDRSAVANYISKYCCKGGFESRKEDIDNLLIERAWSIMSKNIGSEWLEAHKQDYLRFVPETSSIGGDWSVEDFFRFAQGGTDLYYRVMKEIDDLILNLNVYDGDNFKYKMPRYYFDRLINKVRYDERFVSTKRPNLRFANEQNPTRLVRFAYYSPLPEITFDVKRQKSKRFVPESFLSRALSYRISMLVSERDRRNTERLKNDFGYSDIEIIRMSTIDKANALKYREKVAQSNLARFYTTNMWKNREFDE